jgi:hypothetical protein
MRSRRPSVFPVPPLPFLLPAAGVASIAKAIGAAAVKAVVTMVGITVAGRTLLRPLYKRVAGAATAAAIPAGLHQPDMLTSSPPCPTLAGR